jgi:nuclear mRNA export protein PCID2/THP1
MALLINFLTQIRVFVRSQDGNSLRQWLLVEPTASQQYHQLAAELRAQFRQGRDSTAIENTVERCLPEDDDVPDGQATPWPGFVSFVKDYLLFWRDVDFGDLLAAHSLLSGLVKCVTRLQSFSEGHMRHVCSEY